MDRGYRRDLAVGTDRARLDRAILENGRAGRRGLSFKVAAHSIEIHPSHPTRLLTYPIPHPLKLSSTHTPTHSVTPYSLLSHSPIPRPLPLTHPPVHSPDLARKPSSTCRVLLLRRSQRLTASYRSEHPDREAKGNPYRQGKACQSYGMPYGPSRNLTPLGKGGILLPNSSAPCAKAQNKPPDTCRPSKSCRSFA